MDRLFDMMIEALEDPNVSKEDILNWMYSERHMQEVCEEDGDDYSLGSFFSSKFYHGPRPEMDWDYDDFDIEIIDDDDDMDESDFISDELPTHTLGAIIRFHEAYA